MSTNRKQLQKLGQAIGALAMLAVMALIAMAQEFPMHSGNPNRTGLPNDLSGGTIQPNQYNDPGRAFLRWWDPVQEITLELDNDENSAIGNTLATGTWVDATSNATVASNYFQKTVGTSIYRYAALTKATSSTDPTAGATASYQWTFTGLSNGSNYEAYINLPVGPTDVGGGNYYFPQRYWVVKVSGAQAGDRTDVIDYDAHAGGFVRLGNDGNDTTMTFTPTGTTLTVTLYNTAPINENGTYRDDNLNSDPTLLSRELVYADGTMLQDRQTLASASYRASPIVGRLNAANPNGQPENFIWRTVAARNESFVLGDLNRTYNMGTVSSYDFTGTTVPSTFSQRYNRVWDWPSSRPWDNSTDQLNKYALGKRDWILAAGKDRTDQKIQVDNLNGGASATVAWTTSLSTVDNIGPNYLQTPAQTGPATEEARFTANLPESSYAIEVWLPGGSGLAGQVEVDVLEGGTLVDTLHLDQNGPKGWARIPYQPSGGYASSQAAPLMVAITNHTENTADSGKEVYADAVRFVRQADLGISSTPIQLTTTIQTSGGPVARDVVIVAMENGRIYCMDAHGDETTGAPPTVYWTYPTEDASDPNAVPAEDGKDRIAEMPYGFDLSSALVENVGGQDLLYVASTNGKVYCIELSGRGDGTTRRRWTYPDDYDPSAGNQDLPMSKGLLPIKGSVAFGTASGGVPIVLVPTQEGRIIALNAAGTAATKKTSVVWEYPDALSNPLGSIDMTPTVAFGRVFFAAPADQTAVASNLYALDEATGALDWVQDGAALGGFSGFGQASPVAVPGTMLTNPGGTWDTTTQDFGNDRIFACDNNSLFVSVDPTTGNIVWSSNELSAGAAAPLRFSFSTEYDNLSNNLVQNVPTVFVPTLDGTLTGLNAVGLRNKLGTYKVWGYQFEGQAQVATSANGGYNQAVNPHSWIYAGDSQGFLYAFNSIDDNNIFPIIPGRAPGRNGEGPNAPGLDELNSAINPNNFTLISPEAYDQIRELADSPTGIDRTQFMSIVNANKVTRRDFDFGETLYAVIYDMPMGSGSNSNYYVEFELSSAGRPSQRRPQPARKYSDIDQKYVIVGLPLMTTGVGGVGPGPDFLKVRAVSSGNRGLQGAQVRLPKPASFTPPSDCDFYVANPLALAFLGNTGAVSSSVCFAQLGNTDPRIVTDPSNQFWGLYNQNGNSNTDQNPLGAPSEPSGYVGPDLKSKGQPIAHGSTGVQQVYVADRSLMMLLMGRGLSGVRVGPHDVAWVKDGSPTGGVYKPLAQNGVNYPGFEDYPLNVPNTSVDYPDVGRENMSIAANLFGQAQNPLYQSGVSLNAPSFDSNAFQTYRQLAGYESQMTRTLSPTIFELNLDVPHYQPPSNRGYYGSQLLFVDFQSGQSNANPTQGSYRTFGLGLNVAVDERIVFNTPTVDLSSLPEGGGYNGGVLFGPRNPWDGNSSLSPWNPWFNNLFQTFAFSNEGNVNMLNLRTAKYFYDNSNSQNRPVELYMPGQHELAWLDSSLHLHSSLDLRYSASLLVGNGSVGFDPLGHNILQKPRPGDLIGTRFNVNPKSRPNSNLRTVGSYLYNTGQIAPGDAKVGVSAPIGSPAGEYLRRIFVFEDSDTGNDVDPDNPSLGTYEPYTEPGMNLKFTVRESRLTNSPTIKSAPMLEDLTINDPNFLWSNSQPTAMRDGVGNMFVAVASNRLDSGGNPNWTPKSRSGSDLLTQDKWRIYVASLNSVLGNTVGQSPIDDLNAWSANAPTRWYRQAVLVDPPVSNFAVDTGAGESLDASSVSYGSPTFPSSGFFDQFDAPSNTGRSWFTGRYMAFLGNAVKRDGAGNNVELSQIFLAPMTFNADGSINYSPGNVVASPLDPTSQKSRLSLINVHDNTDYATVFATSYSGGFGQIIWQTYDPTQSSGNQWGQGTLRLSNAFENMGAPSAVLRRYTVHPGQAGSITVPRINLTFTAKVRGRKFSEVYFGELACNLHGRPSGRNPLQSFGTQASPFVSELTLDPATGVYWAQGLQWRTDQNSLDGIDITTDPTGNAAGSIWDQKSATRVFDANSGVLKFNTVLGGEAIIDTATGSVRFSGAILKRNTRLYVRYIPTLLRVSQGNGANYRSVASAYDDRFIGVRVYPNDPQRNLLGDLLYWFGPTNAQASVNDALRWDRTVLAYTRTSGDGTASTRPYYQTLRPGVRLRYPVRIGANGQPTLFQVNSWGNSDASEHYVQLDPATGRVFFMAGNEDCPVQITYDAVDENGNYIGQVTDGLVDYPMTVRLMTELDEQALPIEQVGNESALSIALDPLNGTFNNVDPQSGRRPGLLWLFWASSRTGNPDVYFETIAPRFSPRRPNQ